MQKIDLSILPQGGINPIIRCSQGDVGRQFQVELYSEDMSAKYVLDGTEKLTVEGHKPDGNFFSYDLPSTTGSVITVTTQEQMTACYGDVYGEIRIEKGSTLLGTANFTLSVEIGASAQDTVSISALQFIDALRTEMIEAIANTEDARDDAIDAKTDAENARDASQGFANNSSDYADASKAWAVGPSGSGSGSDTNNSNYYSQQALTSATNAESAKNDAVLAKDTAVYAKNDAVSAKDDAIQAKTDAISAKNDAVQAKTDAQTAKADAVQAKNEAVQAKTDAQTAQAGAELAQQKIENMTASASGLSAGSNPTVSKTEIGGVVNLGFGIPKGDKGDKGDTGDNGVSPSASVAQTNPDTITFTVTDKQGTTTATLSAGGAPSLTGCSDVNIQSPSNKQGLVYDSNTSKWVNGQAGGANESLVDWSQTNTRRWRVSRFWSVQYSFGVELELNSVLNIHEGVTNVQFGSQLIQDPMHYGNTYQSAIIDIPLSDLVSVYNGQNVDVLVEGNTYTFDLYNNFANYSYFPATFSFNPGTYDWFEPSAFPPQSVLTRDVVVAGCTISRDNGTVYVRVGLWIRTAQIITTFADLCTALGLFSWGGILGHFAGVIVLSKSKS